MKLSIPMLGLSLLAVTGLAVAQPPEPDEDGWISIETVVKQLAQDMDREFIIDPRVRGIRGFTTNESVDYESLLGILRVNNVAAIETADQIFIIPDQNSRSEPSRLLQEDDPRVADSEIVTRTIKVPESGRTISVLANGQTMEVPAFTAAQLVPVLRPMMSQAAQLAAIPGANSLLLVDRYDNVRRITAVVEAIIEGLDN